MERDEGRAPTRDVAALRAFVDAHLVPGVDVVDGDVLTRHVTGPDGPERLVVDWRRVEATEHPLARRWLGLDTETRTAEVALASDPVVGPLVRARPGLVVPGSCDEFETAVMAVLGQQVTLAAARTFAGRLAAAHGARHGGALLFPTAPALAAVDPGELQSRVGVTTARARTVVALAEAVAGGLDLTASGRRDDLLGVVGVGPWTADYVDLRCRRDPDAFLPGDLVLRRALGGCDAREAQRRSQAWRPHRALALLHLWTAHALVPDVAHRRRSGSTPEATLT
ncbi:DNA-3-methyladenine glycosylase family protein [Agilicoccus flavus]|uniref:DNA-3-methyladenine glycosylase family protein n=1 Tax=Agilicoccus flavus TaxID=2775968 RepID=UPI001CF68BCB|nr:hypothetical protein [Agilicoccus flavus]